MLILNDPFRGGTHLPDVTVVAPVLAADRVIGFCANRAHHADIGSDAPGSMPVSRSLHEEGIVIPPTLLVRQGEPDRPYMDSLLDRLTNAETSRGDFNAQVAANLLGVKRLRELVESMGADRFDEQQRGLQSWAEKLVRQSLATIPEGTCTFTDYLDDDGHGQTDIPVTVTISNDTEGVLVDFEGTACQVRGNLNCPLPVTAAAVFYVFRCLMPEHTPACHGAMLGIRISAPQGCLVNAGFPAAVAAGNVETSSRIVDVVCGALAELLPGRIPAASQGSMNNIAMGKRGGRGWDYYETLAGGMGAGPDTHGCTARHSHMTNTLNTPVEVLELNYPLRILRYAIRRGSGGGGQFRGGDGVIRRYRFLEEAEVSLLTERRVHPPWGISGGRPGKPGRNELNDLPLPGKASFKASAGQTLTIRTPGGGGYGKSSGE